MVLVLIRGLIARPPQGLPVELAVGTKEGAYRLFLCERKLTMATKHASKEQDTVKDEAPALAAVSPVFDVDTPEGVDVASLPGFKDMSRMLPAQRVRAQTRLAQLASSVPHSITRAEEGGAPGVAVYDVSADDLDAVADMIEGIQTLVLENAEDQGAMEAWLIDQKDPLQAVMYAFSRYQAALGN